MSTAEERRFLATAEAAARAAGEHALRRFGQTQQVALRSRNDVKLQIDSDCQAIAENVIRDAFPDHAVLGEEGGAPPLDAEHLWIVDPLDGTVNYFNGLPHWCSSVALHRRGECLAGAVYAPCLGDCFTATRSGAAACNGAAIRVSKTDQLEHALVLTGVSAILADEEKRLACFGRLLANTSKVRVLGAAALDICFVAAGRADALLEYALHLWDFAAGRLILERAGGCYRPVLEVDALRSGCLCSNGRLDASLHALLLDAIEEP